MSACDGRGTRGINNDRRNPGLLLLTNAGVEHERSVKFGYKR